MHAPKSNRDTYIDKARNIFILFQNMILKILNSKVIDSMVLRTCYIYIQIPSREEQKFDSSKI
jgi:hypothetical protein